MEMLGTDVSPLLQQSANEGFSGLRATSSDVAAALKQTVALVSGVHEVRLLSSERRDGRRNHKVFVVLGAHDVERDRAIVELMTQLDGIDWDLVPATAASLIPDAAARL